MKRSRDLDGDRAIAAVVACAVAAALEAKPPTRFVWPVDVFRATRGSPALAFSRQVAVFLLITEFGFSLSRAAAAIGRDRSTVAHARDVVRNWAINDDTDGAEAWLDELAQIARRLVRIRNAQIEFEHLLAPA